jgi:hypothetical protein
MHDGFELPLFQVAPTTTASPAVVDAETVTWSVVAPVPAAPDTSRYGLTATGHAPVR